MEITSNNPEASQFLLLQGADPIQERLDPLEVVRRKGVTFPTGY
jgi:hypothetical protein